MQAEVERTMGKLEKSVFRLVRLFITGRGIFGDQRTFQAVKSDSLAKGYAPRIRRYLCGRVDSARERGDKTVRFRAGDVHKAVGLENQLPNVCQVLKGRLFREMCRVDIVRVISSPPSGRGANLIIEFHIL